MPATRAFFYNLSKSTVKEPALHVLLSEPHAERHSVSRAFFYLSLKDPGEEVPPCKFPQRGPHGEKCPSPEPSFTYPSKSPVKEPPSRSPSQSPHRERRSPSRTFFYLSLNVPGEGVSPPSSPSGAPMERETHPRAFFYISLGALMKKVS
jgi:hypothetical protein